MVRSSLANIIGIAVLGTGFLGLAMAWSILTGPPIGGISPFQVGIGSFVMIVIGAVLLAALQPLSSSDQPETP
jgi:hypothetical protein